MNPSDLMKDAAAILEYALEKYAPSPDLTPSSNQGSQQQLKVLVHGESLGGMAAAYVTMKSNQGQLPVQFAFIDRTFASLDNVAFWTAGIATLKANIDRENGSARSSLTCCCIRRGKFSRILGKWVSRIFRTVTQWKDNNWQNYVGMEKSKAKYCLIGCDPVNDNIIFDLASLKNANARHLIYQKLEIRHNLRSKYSLRLKDYILRDSDVFRMADIFEQWSCLLKDMNFLLKNQSCLDQYFKDH